MCNFIGQASHLPSPPTKEKRNHQPSQALTVQASSSVLYRIVLPSASQHPSPPYSGRIPWSFLLLVPGPHVDEQALHLLHGTHLQSTGEWIRPHHHQKHHHKHPYNHDDQRYHYPPRQRGALVYIFDWKQRQIQFSSLEEQHLFKRETWRIGTATACVPAKKQNQKRQQYQGHHPCDCRVLQIIAFMKCSFEVW